MNGSMNGSTNGTHQTDRVSLAKTEALHLSERKDALEAEMDTIIESLTQNNGPGINGNLIDSDGFPRADIDIIRVREQRNRLARLKNDHQNVSTQLEQLLRIALAPSSEQTTSNSNHVTSNEPERPTHSANNPVIAPEQQQQPSSSAPVPNRPVSDLRQPFAWVDIVFPSSPASDAGLLVNDKIIAIGAVSLRSFPTPTEVMSVLPGLLRGHENRPLDVVIHRPVNDTQQLINLTLTPRVWSGQGLLGCHVLPLEVSQEDPNYAPLVATATENRSLPSI